MNGLMVPEYVEFLTEKAAQEDEDCGLTDAV